MSNPKVAKADVENVQRSLGRCIRQLRSKQGWTQEEFAGICGLHRTYLGHVERGEKNVSLSTVLRVANAFGLGLTELFGRGPTLLETVRLTPAAKSNSANGAAGLNVNRLLAELQTQRKTLQQTVQDLTHCVIQFRDLQQS